MIVQNNKISKYYNNVSIVTLKYLKLYFDLNKLQTTLLHIYIFYICFIVK